MMTLEPEEFAAAARLSRGQLTVMISCAPCTHLSRANPANHLSDRPENSLIGRSGTFAAHLLPEIFLMENARELIIGNYRHHHLALVNVLEDAGYHVRSSTHFLHRFGLPQMRERALIVASRIGEARSLEDLWQGWVVRTKAMTVRTALQRLAEWQDCRHDDPDGDVYPGMGPAVLARLAATPRDGGGWADVARNPQTRTLLTKDCLRRWDGNDLGSHPDVYGRMALDKPAPTIKRECGHVGNGRYAHPTADRLLTVREMAALQGFPFDYRFPARSITNRYRHIGDAVPPLIAFQMSALVKWMKTGRRPEPADFVMEDTVFRVDDVVPG
jgi:DNA (cytosine-5)-methyltransferase 1